MAQPTPYSPAYDFSDFQASNPGDPLPGDKVDIELAAVEITTDDILANLALIQRDDGLLANLSVHPEALASATRSLIVAGGNPRGDWATATAYAVGDIVENVNVYIALVAHTSGTFSTDRDAGKWLLLSFAGALSGVGFFQRFSGIGESEAYTLSQSFGTDEQEVEVYVDGLRIDPTAGYTLSGTTLTIDAAVGTNNILVFAAEIGNVASGGTTGQLLAKASDTDFDTEWAAPYAHPNHSGDVTSSGDGATTIANDAVSNAKLANMAQATIKGRASGAGTGDPVDLTATQVRTIINVENGATADQTGAEIKSAYEGEADTNAFDDAAVTKLAGIAAGAEVNPAVVPQAEAEAGTATTERTWTAQRVAQAIAALETGGGGGGSLDNVVEDTTPQLGGALDVNGQAIVSVAAGDIAIAPDTTGSVILDGLSWPQADGTDGQVLTTDGAGQLAWEDGGAGGGLANVVEDLTPQLGGDLDANGFDIILHAGSAAAPSLAFSGDPNTGLLSAVADTIGLSAGGAEGFRVSTGVVAAFLPLRLTDGSAAFPAIAFTSDANTGLYRVGADQLGISAGGTVRLTVDTAAIRAAVPHFAQDGSVSSPAYSFTSDPNTGFYSVANDSLGVTVGGVQALQIDEATTITFIFNDHLLTRAVMGDFAIQNASPASAAGALTLNYTTGPDFDLELAENVTTLAITNWPASPNLGKVTLQLRQPTSGTHTVDFTDVDFGDALEPTMPTGTGAVLEVAIWTRDGGTTKFGSTYFEKAGA